MLFNTWSWMPLPLKVLYHFEQPEKPYKIEIPNFDFNLPRTVHQEHSMLIQVNQRRYYGHQGLISPSADLRGAENNANVYQHWINRDPCLFAQHNALGEFGTFSVIYPCQKWLFLMQAVVLLLYKGKQHSLDETLVPRANRFGGSHCGTRAHGK